MVGMGILFIVCFFVEKICLYLCFPISQAWIGRKGRKWKFLVDSFNDDDDDSTPLGLRVKLSYFFFHSEFECSQGIHVFV